MSEVSDFALMSDNKWVAERSHRRLERLAKRFQRWKQSSPFLANMLMSQLAVEQKRHDTPRFEVGTEVELLIYGYDQCNPKAEHPQRGARGKVVSIYSGNAKVDFARGRTMPRIPQRYLRAISSLEKLVEAVDVPEPEPEPEGRAIIEDDPPRLIHGKTYRGGTAS
jgi:hypothetical protein